MDFLPGVNDEAFIDSKLWIFLPGVNDEAFIDSV